MLYILKRKDVEDEYFYDIDFSYEVATSSIDNAKIFYSKEDAEIFNKDYLHNGYSVKELKED